MGHRYGSYTSNYYIRFAMKTKELILSKTVTQFYTFLNQI